jgi:hypothetical protein
MLNSPEHQKQGSGSQIKQIINFRTYCCRRVTTILNQIFEGSAITNYTGKFHLMHNMKKYQNVTNMLTTGHITVITNSS